MRLHLLQSITVLLICATLAALSAFSQTNDAIAGVCDAKVKVPDYSLPAWPENANVKVYIVGANFTPAEIAAILIPVTNWTAIAQASGSKVTFVYSGTVAMPQDCLDCLTIMHGRVHDNQKHAAELHAYVIQGERRILYARILIDPVIPNLTALTNAVAHELGHNFGLPDCFSCRAHNTVMSLIRSSNGFDGPTSCDVAQVRRIYEHARTQATEMKKHQRSQPVAKAVPMDEGEEPVEDDTPVVIPPRP